MLKWCWCRIPGGVVSWKAYEQFKQEEDETGHKQDSFFTIMPRCVESEFHATIVFDFFDLLASVATHGRKNGLGGRKLSRLAGTWAFDIRTPKSEEPTSFADGLAAWSVASEATNHLFTAFLRNLDPTDMPEIPAPPFGRLPKPLEVIARSMPYPPKPLFKSRLVAVPMVTLTVGKLSANPMVLLRRVAKTIRFDNPPIFHSEDDFNTLYFLFSDPDAIEYKISPESLRILNEVIQENPISTDHPLLIKDTPNQPHDIRGKSWSKFYNHAYIDPVSGDVSRPLTNYIYDEGQIKHVLNASVPSQEKPSLPYPEDRHHHHHHYRGTDYSAYGFDKYEQPSSRKKISADNLVTASISQIAIDDFFVWVWMSSLSAEQTEIRKATFGRSVVVELEVGPGEAGKRWVVVEEILYPEPAPMKPKQIPLKEPPLDKYKTRRVVSSPPITRPVPRPPKDTTEKRKSKKRQSVEKHYHHHHPYYYQGLDPALVEAIAKKLQQPKRESVSAETQTYQVAETQTEEVPEDEDEFGIGHDPQDLQEFAEAVAAAINNANSSKTQTPTAFEEDGNTKACQTLPPLIDRGIGTSPPPSEQPLPTVGSEQNAGSVVTSREVQSTPLVSTTAIEPPSNLSSDDTASVYYTPYMAPVEISTRSNSPTKSSRDATPNILRPTSLSESPTRRSISLQHPIRSTLENDQDEPSKGHVKNQASDISTLKLGDNPGRLPTPPQSAHGSSSLPTAYLGRSERPNHRRTDSNIDKPLPPPPEENIAPSWKPTEEIPPGQSLQSSPEQQRVKRKPVGAPPTPQQRPQETIPEDRYYEQQQQPYDARGRARARTMDNEYHSPPPPQQQMSDDEFYYRQRMMNEHRFRANREMSPNSSQAYRGPPPPHQPGGYYRDPYDYYGPQPPPPPPPPGRMRGGPPPSSRYHNRPRHESPSGYPPSTYSNRSSAYMTDGSSYGSSEYRQSPESGEWMNSRKGPPSGGSGTVGSFSPGGMPSSGDIESRIGPQRRFPKKQPMMRGDDEFYQRGPGPNDPSMQPHGGRVVSNYERGRGYEEGGGMPPPMQQRHQRNQSYPENISPKTEVPPPPPPGVVGGGGGRPYSHSGVGPLPRGPSGLRQETSGPTSPSLRMASPPVVPTSPSLQVPATNETSIDAKTKPRVSSPPAPTLTTQPQRRVASREALRSPPPPATQAPPYPRVTSPPATAGNSLTNSSVESAERRLGFKTPAEVKAEAEAANEAERLADTGLSKKMSNLTLDEKPLPLDPKWSEVKQNLASMREKNEHSKVPVMVDSDPNTPDAGQPADEYFDAVMSTMRRPSVNTGEHVRSIVVKDNGDAEPIGEEDDGIVYNSPFYSVDANDYFNSERSIPLASTLGFGRSHSIIGKSDEVADAKPEQPTAPQRRNSTGNDTAPKVPTVVPKHTPNAFDPKNELSVFRAAKAGLLDPGSPSKQAEEEKVSKYSIAGIVNAVNKKKDK